VLLRPKSILLTRRCGLTQLLGAAKIEADRRSGLASNDDIDLIGGGVDSRYAVLVMFSS
jgi:hypothetical protein